MSGVRRRQAATLDPHVTRTVPVRPLSQAARWRSKMGHALGHRQRVAIPPKRRQSIAAEVAFYQAVTHAFSSSAMRRCTVD
jgi:hypothetical protein